MQARDQYGVESQQLRAIDYKLRPSISANQQG